MSIRGMTRLTAIIALLALGGIGASATSADATDDQQADGHHEAPDEKSIYIQPDRRITSPGGRYRFGGYLSVQVNVDGSGQNILGDAANEPSLAMDPNDHSRMCIGWRQFDTITSNFRQAGYGYTTDGGQTWTFPGVIEPGIFRSDPVLDSDADGVFYYNSLTSAGGSGFHCKVFRSFDGGQTWDAGVEAFGGDKQWMTIDKTDGMGRGNIYAVWNQFYSSCDGDLTYSYDGGDTWEPCLDVPGGPTWGVLTVGPDGEVYIADRDPSIMKSSTILDPNLPPAFDFVHFVDLGGPLGYHSGPNPGGLLGQMWVATDHSDGVSRGNVYMLGSVDPSGSDPLDVMFARSTDGGETWSPPVRINDDPTNNGAWQWFGTISVAPNGRIDVIWLDTRNDPGGYDSQLMYSFSEDEGETWSPNEFLGPAFDPHVGWPQQNKMGDYFHMVSTNTAANLAYAATYNGEQDVYFIRIPAPVACPADVTGDGVVDVLDLLSVLAAWGPCAGCSEDINGDEAVDVLDLLALLAGWGPCPTEAFGACCLSDGTCQVTSWVDCASTPWAVWYEGEECSTFACPPPPLGACCYYPSGDCTDVTQMDCFNSGGSWQGGESSCAGIQCPIPLEGDSIENALLIPDLPIEINGSTAGFHDDYDELCPTNPSTSPDVVYAYTPTSTIVVAMSMCVGQTDYDTKLYVYENTAGNLVACSDDYCSTPYPNASKLSGVAMNAGSTYYIVVDGTNGQWGNYTLAVSD